MRYEQEIEKFLKHYEQWFDWEDYPYFSTNETYEVLEGIIECPKEKVEKAIKKMAKIGLIVNYELDKKTAYIAIEKMTAAMWLMPPVTECPTGCGDEKCY